MSSALLTPIALVGPTAAGKSEAALSLAEQLGGEIISVDSIQVYRGLDIGSAKLSMPERLGVPHHLIDVAGLTEPFDAKSPEGNRRAGEASYSLRWRRILFYGAARRVGERSTIRPGPPPRA
jgi:tRNA dimethylallyltransferase